MRRYSYSIIASAILLVGFAAVASAQTGQLRGKVLIQQADGTKAPASGAQVDVYRTDLPGKYPTKTNKNGEFVFAGLPYVGTYLIAVSAPNATPATRANVKAGRDIEYEVVMSPGDGRRLSEAEAKAGGGGGAPAAGTPANGESAEEKAKREEIERQNAAILEANKKAENANQIVGDAFKAGNAAYTAKNYDEAVKQFEIGLGAGPDHPGVPQLLTNKATALRQRGVIRYNAGAQLKEEAARKSGMDEGRADFKAAAEAACRAVELYKKLPAATDPAQIKQNEQNKYFALKERAESMRLYATTGDITKAEEAATAYQEYMEVETDPVKKAKAQTDMAQMLFDSGAHDKAKVEFEKILAERPDDVDALASMGMILYSLGYQKDSEGKKEEAKADNQRAANYLQQFVDKAPDTHRLKAGAKEVLEALKAQNVQAEKPASRPRPTRRP